MMMGHNFIKLFIIILIYTLDDADGKSLNGTIKPLQPIMKTSELNISCSLPAVLDVDDTRVTSQHLYFNAGEVITSSSVIVDELTINLTLTNVSRFHNHVNLFCYANVSGAPYLVAQSKIIIFEPLVAPHLNGCIVYNWLEMVCTWEPAYPDFGIKTDTTFLYQMHCLTKASPCPVGDQEPGSCRIRNYFHASYCIHICFNNSESRACSNITKIEGNHEVKPPPVKIEGQTISSKSSMIKFKEAHEIEKVSYHVELKSVDKIELIKFNESRVIINGLRPVTWYNMTVWCIPLVKNDDILVEKGHFSDPQTFRFVTEPDVPDENPKLVPGSFYFDSSISADGKAYAHIFWQKISQKSRNGRLNHTKISYWQLDAEKNETGEPKGLIREECDPEDTMYQLKAQIDRKKDYMVEVEIVNEKGSNASIEPSRIVIPSITRVPNSPEHFYATMFNNDIKLKWTNVEWVDSYTIYQCYLHYSTRNCLPNHDIKWDPDIPSGTTELIIPYPDSDIKIGISVERFDSELNRMVSSGVTWAKCIHKDEAEVLPPRNLHFSPQQNPHSLTIVWNHPECSQTKYISGYEISWCKRIHEICAVNANDTGCCPKNASITVPRSDSSWVLKNLDPDSEYEVTLRSLSFDGVSEISQGISHKVLDSGVSKAVIILIVIACILFMTFCPFILYLIIKNLMKSRQQLPIDVPKPRDITESVPGYTYTKCEDMVKETNIDDPEVPLANGTTPLVINGNSGISMYTSITCPQHSSSLPSQRHSNDILSYPSEMDIFLQAISARQPSVSQVTSEHINNGHQRIDIPSKSRGKENVYV